GALTLDHDALEYLDPLPVALDHAEVHAHRVARLEARHVAQLTALDVLDRRAHVERWPEAARNGSESGYGVPTPAPRGRAGSADRDPRGRPVGREDLADQVLFRDAPPLARVARRVAVVAHHEVVPRRDRE